MSSGIPCMWMRGGTSKGGYFLAEDLPGDVVARNQLLQKVMGSPDVRQIDGMGGADPLTSKVAVVQRSAREGVDVDYLFLQVAVDEPLVSDGQNCGNILAGVGPFAIERGLVEAHGESTKVVIYMENTGQVAEAIVSTPGGKVCYDGEAQIHGVPGSHAPVPIVFHDTAGSSCGALLPSGRAQDVINDVACTLIDNGMPCIVIAASEVGITGYEDRATLDNDASLKSRIEGIRLKAGPLMNLGDVAEKTVPKIMLVAPPRDGGAICVRSFIPHRAHASIGVLGAVTVASACFVQDSVAQPLAVVPDGSQVTLAVEHPTGDMGCVLSRDADGDVVSAGLLRTARKLMDGEVYV